ncbi:MAG: hypothetical protein H6Q27_199, partial [Ignavibacteriaceae bacterium]|nr:hypothetical protein [Ignavibacteriaceae bacterium]
EVSSFNLDEVVLPDLEGGQVSEVNLQEDVSIESPFETLIDETEIDYPQVEEVDVDKVLAENESPSPDIPEQITVDESENISSLVDQQSD